MKSRIEKIVEHGKDIKLEDAKIGEKEFLLKIVNSESLNMEFRNSEDKFEYSILIEEKGISFQRYLHRPNHDEDEREILQVVVDEKVLGHKKGELVWRSEFPHKKEGYDFFYVPFGSATSKY